MTDPELATHLRDVHRVSVAGATDADRLMRMHQADHALDEWDHLHDELPENRP